MIHYVIIDDEKIAHDIIKEYCDVLPDFKLARNCYDAIEALEFLRINKVDLLFLDLNMPKLKGFDFLKTLEKPPKVIVTTAYKEFALEGYELNIVDYLLKPFGFERFLKAVNKINKPEKLSIPKEAGITKSVFFKVNGTLVQQKIEEIMFVEAIGNYCKIITTSSNTLVVRNTLAECVAMINSEYMVQVHKSFVISINHIKIIEGNRIQMDGYSIPVGRTYKINLQKFLQ